jgi:hypothetical protein
LVDVETFPVGEIQEIQKLIDRFRSFRNVQQVVKNKYKFTHWREIKGDGNCYYRAFMLGLIENLVYDRDNKPIFKLLFKNLDDVLKEVQQKSTGDGGDNEEERSFLSMLNMLKIWFQNLPPTMEDVVDQLNQSQKEDLQSLDRSLVMFARLMCRSFIQKHLEWTPNNGGLTLSQLILTTTTYSNVQQYIKQEVTESLTYAEGIILDPGILPHAFHINCYIFQLYPGGVRLNKTSLKKSKYKYKYNINLLFFPAHGGGHYCYLVPIEKEQQKEDVNPADVPGFSEIKGLFPAIDNDTILNALMDSNDNLEEVVAKILSSSGGGGDH